MSTLIIDPNPESVAARLRTHCPHLQILEAISCGRAGLEAARRLAPDAIFLNLDLPDISGLEVLEELARGTAATLVAASEGSTFSRETQACGVAAFLVAPFDGAELRDAFAQATAKTPTPPNA
jgi:two-component system, LytTR family, response regulator